MCMGNGKAYEFGDGKPTGKPSGKGKPTGKPSGKGKGKGKGGNSGKCPDFADIIQMIEKEYKTEYCVLQAVEWVDEKGEIDQDVIDEDISKPPAGVQEGLDEDKMKMCVQ